MDNGYEEKGKEIKARKRKGNKLTYFLFMKCVVKQFICSLFMTMRDKTEEAHSYVWGSLCPGSMCIPKGPLQASRADTNTENCCLSLEQATCLLNNSLAVWQWDGTSSSWGLGPTCHPKLLPLQLHWYDGPTRAPLHRHRLCIVVPHLRQKSSLVSSGLLLAGLCMFDAGGQRIYPLRSLWYRTFLWWCSV